MLLSLCGPVTEVVAYPCEHDAAYQGFGQNAIDKSAVVYAECRQWLADLVGDGELGRYRVG